MKDNQPKILQKMKTVFAKAPQQEPNDRRVTKKRGGRDTLFVGEEMGGGGGAGAVGRAELLVADSSGSPKGRGFLF